MKQIFESEPIKPGTDELLGKLEDSLVELKEKNKISEEDLKLFRTNKEGIEAMEDEEGKQNEKFVLLQRYRNLVKSKQEQPEK